MEVIIHNHKGGPAMKSFAKYAVTLALIACIALPLGAEARDHKFQGSSDETYYMCVFVSGVDYWFSVYETMKDAGKQLGVKTV